ncbi:MAG TPA: JDVT-CTERM system glutamic-type intramembrane protease [Verrucomicrobiae bacterium]|nr:JDVT-CTERM system glutamic-type intramembrane protease [Verrucomicrobiae bacterium]
MLRDRWLLAAFAAAIPVWGALIAWKGAPDPTWIAREPLRFLLLALVYPILEEIVFRGLIQGELLKRLRAKAGPLSAANAITSAVFTALHLALRPSWLALGTLPVSLVLGHFRERHGGLAAPIALHVFYNTGFLLLVYRASP